MEGDKKENLSKSSDWTSFVKKKVMIIGASGSIGKACSIWYLNHGATVVMVSRKMNEIEAVASLFPSQSICIECDLISDEEQFDMVNGALEALGGLDILVNCQGVFFENDLMSTYPQDHDYLVDINLRSFFHISQLCSVALKRSQGCIVNISGLSQPQQGMISYCMTKSGLNMLTKCLALELAPVRVNAVSPGLLNNDFLKGPYINSNDLKGIKGRVRTHNPLKRLGRVDEVVKAVILLTNQKHGNVTGQIFNISGGMNLTGSCFVDWDCSDKMNSKFLPTDVKPIYKVANWIGKKVDRIVKNEPPENWKGLLLENSKWSTDMADAHIKIYDNYDKIEETQDILGIIQDLKGEVETYDPVEGGYSPRISGEFSRGIIKLARVSADNSIDLSPVRRSSALV